MAYTYRGGLPEPKKAKPKTWAEHGRGCGTPAGYAAHIRTGTEKCHSCRQANTEYRRIIRRKARGISMKTSKGYALTAAQIDRRGALAHYLIPGPSYRRDIRDALASLQYAETSAQVDYWLEQADRMTYDYR